jgi:DNA-directed RNA polymerase specialized sigma24 family protein
MNASNFFGSQHTFADAKQQALYETLGGFLAGLLMRKFDVPRDDAELLVFQTFHVYYQGKVPVANEREWLSRAACDRADRWRQDRGLPPANNAEIAQDFTGKLSCRDGREMLPERAQKALRLRFAEKKTYEEIATELGVPTFLAQHIVTKAVGQLRGLLKGGGGWMGVVG